MLVILVLPDCSILISLFLTIFVTTIFLAQITQTTQINSLSKSIHSSVFYAPSKFTFVPKPFISMSQCHLVRFSNSIIRLFHPITKSHSCGILAPTGCQSHRYKVIPTRSCYIESSSTRPLSISFIAYLSFYAFALLCYFVPPPTRTYVNS